MLNKRPLWLVVAGLFLWFAVWFLAHLSDSRSSELLSSRKAASPRPAQLTAVARGRLVYEQFGCGMCHGPDGNHGIRNPNSQTGKIPAVIYVKESYTLPELKKRILKGVSYIPPADPKKEGAPDRMPGWEDRMSEQEANDLCEYLFGLMPEEAEEEW